MVVLGVALVLGAGWMQHLDETGRRDAIDIGRLRDLACGVFAIAPLHAIVPVTAVACVAKDFAVVLRVVDVTCVDALVHALTFLVRTHADTAVCRGGERRGSERRCRGRRGSGRGRPVLRNLFILALGRRLMVRRRLVPVWVHRRHAPAVRPTFAHPFGPVRCKFGAHATAVARFTLLGTAAPTLAIHEMAGRTLGRARQAGVAEIVIGRGWGG